MESEPDTSDSSSDSELEDDSEIVDDGKLDRLEAKVIANPNDYTAHRELIAGLRESANFEKLREARESFYSLLVLQKDDWIQWIEDESRLANVSSPDQVQKVLELCKRATKDFQYIEIWELYLRFVEHVYSRNIEPDNEDKKIFEDSIKAVRNAYEDALSHVGMHLAKGSSLWTKYLNFEISVHSTLKSKKTALNKQEEAVRNIAKRGLSIPLTGLEDLHETYTTWETAIGQTSHKDIELALQTSLKQLSERKSFEDSIYKKQQEIQDDQNWQQQLELIQLWISYVKFEVDSPENKKNPSRAVSLFERAVENVPNSVQLWQTYLNYLEQKLGGRIVLEVFDRAIRNYPWSAELWGQYISAMEKHTQTFEQITTVFEKAFNMSGVFQTAEDYMTLLQRYLEYLHRTFSLKNDNNTQLISKWRETLTSATNFFSQYFKDNLAPVELFKYWATIERRLVGDFEACRNALESMVKTYPKSIDAWIFYVEFLKTQILLSKTDPKLVSSLQHQCRSIIKRMVNNCLPHEDKDEAAYLELISQTSQYDVDRIYHTWLEFERLEGSLPQWEVPYLKYQQILATRTVQQTPPEPRPSKKQKRKIGDDRRQGEVESLPSKKQKRNAELGTGSFDAERDKRTAFVVNLPFSVSQQEIQDLFSKYGSVIDVRMVLDKDGKPKGYGYVEFADEAGANASLALHQTELKGRKLKVTISSPRAPSTSSVHYNDVATVFVKNIPATINETDLTQHFQQCGNVKDVRIVKRDGISRGFAYIQFGDESGVDKALAMNDTELSGQKISVAKSAPPTKKGVAAQPQPQAVKPRLLVPRSLKKPETAVAQSENASTNEPVGSNEAFRKKFLKTEK